MLETNDPLAFGAPAQPEELVRALPAPRAVWVMVPAGLAGKTIATSYAGVLEAWLQREGLPERPTNRGAGPMDAAAEARLWAAHEQA